MDGQQGKTGCPEIKSGSTRSLTQDGGRLSQQTSALHIAPFHSCTTGSFCYCSGLIDRKIVALPRLSKRSTEDFGVSWLVSRSKSLTSLTGFRLISRMMSPVRTPALSAGLSASISVTTTPDRTFDPPNRSAWLEASSTVTPVRACSPLPLPLSRRPGLFSSFGSSPMATVTSCVLLARRIDNVTVVPVAVSATNARNWPGSRIVVLL